MKYGPCKYFPAISVINMHANYSKVQQLLYGSGQKMDFELIPSWKLKTNKLKYQSVRQKKRVGNPARDFYTSGGRKTIKSLT